MTTPTIQLGAILALRNDRRISCWPQVSHDFYNVGRLTATQAIAVGPRGEIRVRLKDLGVVGEPYQRAAIATEEMQAQHTAEQAELKRFKAAYQQTDDLIDRPLHQLNLSTDQLEALAEAWVKIKAMKATTP